MALSAHARRQRCYRNESSQRSQLLCQTRLRNPEAVPGGPTLLPDALTSICSLPAWRSAVPAGGTLGKDPAPGSASYGPHLPPTSIAPAARSPAHSGQSPAGSGHSRLDLLTPRQSHTLPETFSSTRLTCKRPAFVHSLRSTLCYRREVSQGQHHHQPHGLTSWGSPASFSSLTVHCVLQGGREHLFLITLGNEVYAPQQHRTMVTGSAHACMPTHACTHTRTHGEGRIPALPPACVVYLTKKHNLTQVPGLGSAAPG